jgi:hypothetical protein
MPTTHQEVIVSRFRLALVALATVAASLLLSSAAMARTHDRNHDRIPDRWEKRHHLSLHHNQARRDQDRDGLRNRGEFKARTNPRDADSDNDGIEDGDENAGTISSFDGRTLVISLAGGGSLSGIVDGDTEIECEDAHAHAARDGDDESGDDHGDDPADHDAGDDHGDDPADHDAGDDHGDDDRASCGRDALTAGATVAEAELRARRGTATFEEVELAG